MTNRDGGRLSLLDATFLHIETRDTPMHVASLHSTCSRPPPNRSQHESHRHIQTPDR